jgi:hypothetical protein
MVDKWPNSIIDKNLIIVLKYQFRIKMRTSLQILILLCSVQVFQAQDNSGYRIMRSNVGSSGSSQTVVTSSGTYKISQSIGQASVIGTHYNNGYYLRQGYQQPMHKIKIVEEFDLDLNAKIHPNPFNQTIRITFSSKIEEDISVKIFDIHGRIVHAQEFLPAQNLELRLNDISSGSYFLKAISKGKHFTAKLIKF